MPLKTLPENLHQRPHFEQFWVAAGQEHTFDQIQLSGSSSGSSLPLMQILQKSKPCCKFIQILRTLQRIPSNSSSPPANSSQFFALSSKFLQILRILQQRSASPKSETREKCKEHEKNVKNMRKTLKKSRKSVGAHSQKHKKNVKNTRKM